jgi:AraC family transcriptional regulator
MADGTSVMPQGETACEHQVRKSTSTTSPNDLPAVPSYVRLPEGREFYGAISGLIRRSGLEFGLVTLSGERLVPDHTHETSYYSLVVSGRYDESHRRGRVYFQPFSSALTRSGTEHDEHVAAGGVRVFTVEIGEEWIRQFRELHREPETVQDLTGGQLTWLGIRLYREYRADSLSCALTVDALVWELLAAAADIERQSLDSKPSWWTRVLDLLHSEFKRNLRISEVAAEAGVHPIHLARVFRRFCRQTPGEYVQRLRVRFAAENLAHLNDGIAQIAADAGFSDQSHLTRIFKRYAQMTPGEFRHALITRTRKSIADPPRVP